MAIDKNADFTPSIPDSGVVPTKLPYNPTGSFKFWAQKVIPLVYDDSLSYYEVLCKVVTYLNNVIQNVDNLNESVNSTNQSFETLKGYVNTTKDTLINTYNELQDYVNTYFDNLDVQEEINEKLDAMADSGELTNLLAPFIPDLVTQWLNNHVTPTSPIIDDTLTISGAGADAKVTGDKITELKEDLSESVGDLKNALNKDALSYKIYERSSVNRSTGEIIEYAGYKRTDYIPLNGNYLIVDTDVNASGSSLDNCFYDSNKNFISSFRVWGINPYEKGINGYRNIYEIPENAKYAIISGTNSFMNTVTVKNTNNRNDWSWIIASVDSVWAKDADVLCHSTKDDGNTIYKFMTEHHSHHDVYYLAPDSVFTLKTPVKPYSDTSIKSDGAKFTQPNMVTKKFAENANVGANNIVLENITDLTYVGMWLYIVDDSGNYESNEIVNYNESTNTLVLKYPLSYTYTIANNAVVKSANSCFLFGQSCNNIEVDGITIDWNVDNNPQQTYNPDFVQDGFSLDQAKNIRIKNCTILNGGRRGICGYDATNILVENCYIENWSEHGIDWYCTRGKNGNTATLPILIDAKVINTICCNNTLCGIQNHRGSGVSIIGCELYGNAHGLRMQEYAHDVTVTGCVIRDNTRSGVNILSNSNKLSLVGNVITKNAFSGVEGVGSNKLLIADNQISCNGQRGVYLENTHQCEIEGNHINNNNLDTDPSNNDWYFAGIGLVNSNYNKVANNYCSKDDGTMKYGIYERSSSNNNVINDNYTLGSTNNVYKSGANSIERNNDLFAIS